MGPHLLILSAILPIFFHLEEGVLVHYFGKPYWGVSESTQGPKRNVLVQEVTFALPLLENRCYEIIMVDTTKSIFGAEAADPHGDYWLKCMSQNGEIRGFACDVTELAKKFCAQNELGPDIEPLQKLFAQTIVGGVLSAATLKSGERLNIRIQATGLIEVALLDVLPTGKIRANLRINPNPTMDLDPLNALKDRRVSIGPWGFGTISFVRSKETDTGRVIGTPFTSTAPLLTGHFPKDLTFYFAQSEQVPSTIGINIDFKDGIIQSARGFLIQAMPGATGFSLESIEKRVSELSQFALKPEGMLAEVMADLPFTLLDRRSVETFCTCSQRKVHSVLEMLGEADLLEIIQSGTSQETKCDFCKKVYTVTIEQIKEIMVRIKTRQNESEPTTEVHPVDLGPSNALNEMDMEGKSSTIEIDFSTAEFSETLDFSENEQRSIKSSPKKANDPIDTEDEPSNAKSAKKIIH